MQACLALYASKEQPSAVQLAATGFDMLKDLRWAVSHAQDFRAVWTDIQGIRAAMTSGDYAAGIAAFQDALGHAKAIAADCPLLPVVTGPTPAPTPIPSGPIGPILSMRRTSSGPFVMDDAAMTANLEAIGDGKILHGLENLLKFAAEVMPFIVQYVLPLLMAKPAA